MSRSELNDLTLTHECIWDSLVFGSVYIETDERLGCRDVITYLGDSKIKYERDEGPTLNLAMSGCRYFAGVR